MPIKQNAKKAMRQAKKRAERNLIVRDAFKNAIKITHKAITAGKEDLKEDLRLAQKALDKAAKRGVIKTNTAARKLSRLMKKAKKVVKK
jgi:small subunit ribosomal protein S20